MTFPWTKRVTSIVLLYAIAYLVYLWFFVDFENEFTHWLTLVVLPTFLVWARGRRFEARVGLSEIFRFIGFNRARLKSGIVWGVVSGVALGCLQLVFSRQSGVIWQLMETGQFFVRFPVAFLLMFFTAGFTEEYFFRGILQGTLAERFGRRWPAIAIASVFFGVYHFPYAYLLDTWPSHGNMSAAIAEGVVMSAVMGMILGVIYARVRHILAPMICHALFNAVVFSAKWNFNIEF